MLTGTGRSPSATPTTRRRPGWRDIESVADEVRALGRTAVTAGVATSPTSRRCRRCGPRTIDELGRVDIVVNNAGAARGDDRVPVVDLDPTLWRTVIDVNLTGIVPDVEGLRHGCSSSRATGGSIVNISSIAGKLLSPMTAAYAASKAGLQALTACMSGEVGRSGVRVNAICPGVIDTSRMDDLGRESTSGTR